jgi:xanthine dehydrogenase iron-sulfur cluster and FAD-binding subunit A
VWQDYYSVSSVNETLRLLSDHGGNARIIAGATDLILEMERGLRKDIDALVDVSRIPSLDQITLDDNDVIHLGPLVTHNQCVASMLLVERAFPLAQAAWAVGSPQIRNRGTIAGNVITASPANDTITPLMALGARLTLRSNSGERVVLLEEFYSGVRKTLMQPDEILIDIAFPALKEDQRGAFIKLGLRRAQAISVINLTIIITLKAGRVKQAVITLGAVAPVIIHARQAEEYLAGRELDENTISQAAELAMQAALPIDDIRGSLEYRREVVRVCTARGLRALSRKDERAGVFPERPVFLWGKNLPWRTPKISLSKHHTFNVPIVTRINGKEYTITSGQHKSLMRLLREDANLIGTKEGCAEGECGACTIYLDGMAVMSCLVPAPRAHGAEIVTIEGLAQGEQLHPLQQAFIQEGAVQCGYCTPGFIMSGAILLEEEQRLTRQEIQQSLTGNLCRCTGYYKIVRAIERAAQEMAHV